MYLLKGMYWAKFDTEHSLDHHQAVLGDHPPHLYLVHWRDIPCIQLNTTNQNHSKFVDSHGIPDIKLSVHKPDPQLFPLKMSTWRRKNLTCCPEMTSYFPYIPTRPWELLIIGMMCPKKPVGWRFRVCLLVRDHYYRQAGRYCLFCLMKWRYL